MSSINEQVVTLKNGILITIRTAESSDASGIIRLMKGILSEKVFAIHEIDEYKETVASTTKKIRQYRKAPGKIILTASYKNEIVGYVTFNNWDTRKTMHTGFLSIYLLKKYRGMGLGKELMKMLLQWGKDNKLIQKMSLAVFSSNKNAIALYKKVGFKIEGLCPKDIKINGRYYDSVFMYKFV
jgi:RimJ/RimL family protein N-acetyltransferase